MKLFIKKHPNFDKLKVLMTLWDTCSTPHIKLRPKKKFQNKLNPFIRLIHLHNLKIGHSIYITWNFTLWYACLTQMTLKRASIFLIFG